MVFKGIFQTIAGTAVLTMTATPALANSSASADMTGAIKVENASQAPLGAGDGEFSQLFANWEQMDANEGRPGFSPIQIAVPSTMPLHGAKLTSGFGMRTHPVIGGRRAHKGIDLAAPTGTPVYATADGVIDRADVFSSYGLFVRIEHGAGLETRFAHLSKLAVAAGQRVKKGELIGYVGTTGRSTGPHLHYEVRMDGAAVNPLPYMAPNAAQQNFALALGEGGMGGMDDHGEEMGDDLD